MSKKTQKVFYGVELIIAIGIRIAYFLLVKTDSKDVYGLYESAMVKAEKVSLPLTSGLSFAYAKFLSEFLKFVGNKQNTVIMMQMILELIAFALITFAFYHLFGHMSGLLAGFFFSIGPVLLGLTHAIGGRAFLIFHIGIVFCLLAYYDKKTNLTGWYRSNLCELVLIAVGLYTGTIIAWNYLGFVLVGVIIYLLIKNASVIEEYLRLDEEENGDIFEKQQVMPIWSQIMILFLGIFLGYLWTLIRYTGQSGEYITGQLKWWILQFKSLIPSGMGIEFIYALCVCIMMLVSSVVGKILSKAVPVSEEKDDLEQSDSFDFSVDEEKIEEPKIMDEKNPIIESIPLDTKQTTPEAGSFIAPDGREIAYLENPLPVPKKHVKKDFEFDYDFDISSENDFEIKVVDNFDI